MSIVSSFIITIQSNQLRMVSYDTIPYDECTYVHTYYVHNIILCTIGHHIVVSYVWYGSYDTISYRMYRTIKMVQEVIKYLHT